MKLGDKIIVAGVVLIPLALSGFCAFTALNALQRASVNWRWAAAASLAFLVVAAAVGLVTAGTLLWTQGGELRVTLVLRTAYALMPGALTAVQPEGVDAYERHYHGDPARAVRTAARALG